MGKEINLPGQATSPDGSDEMMELEKVIKAIECCIDEKHGCYNCEFKYKNGKVACRMFEKSYNSIPTELIKNVLELLKEQHKGDQSCETDGASP